MKYHKTPGFDGKTHHMVKTMRYKDDSDHLSHVILRVIMPKCPYCPDGWHVICPCDDFDDCDYKDKLRKKDAEDSDYPDED